ncbi:MAG: trypsin-like peptidase domain-containing protein [Bacteroidota bacterium]
MKQLIKSFALCLAAGITGAFSYSYLTDKSGREPNGFSYANYSPQAFTGQQGSSAGGAQSPYGSLGRNAIMEDFVAGSAAATPCVVYIKTVSAQPQTSWFDMWFNGGGGKQLGSGSGVIYSHDGYVITNNHVINNAENIEVIHEKRSYSATVIGIDPNADIAVLKIKGDKLPAIHLADSKRVQVGEWVLAVGNPFNLNSTVTAGIVSAKGRNLNIVNSQFPIESFIQTDAAINPGNSGGALVNLKGELIGINTAIYSQTGSYAGYGFAVPSAIVDKIVKDLIKYGDLQKVFFGADITDLTSQMAERLNTNDLDGVVISAITPGEAALKAGLEKGDIILKIDGLPVNSKANFDEELYYRNPGDVLRITYRRNNKVAETTVTLTNREGTTGVIRREVYNSSKLGANLEAISKVERDRYGVEGGVRIVNQTGRGLLARMGITEDFIITTVNYKSIRSPKQLEEELDGLRGKVLIEGVTKNGQKGYYSFYF